MSDNCAAAAAACYFEETGEDSCGGMLNCMGECGAEEGCAYECVDSSTAAAQTAYMAIIYCIYQFCDDFEDPDCVNNAVAAECSGYMDACTAGCTPECGGQECGPDGCGGSCGSCVGTQSCQQGSCVGPSGTGELLNCMELQGCIADCTGDTVCTASCFEEASEQGGEEYSMVADCTSASDCTDSLCMAIHCAAETAICAFEGSGTSGCGDGVYCMQDCSGSDPACLMNCLEAMDGPAQAHYTALAYCMVHYCPDYEQGCQQNVLSNECADFANMCLAD
jgi:hypothetical protein